MIIFYIKLYLYQFCRDNWDRYLGDCNAVSEYIKTKQNQDSPKKIFVAEILMFFNIYFRSIGQVKNIKNHIA